MALEERLRKKTLGRERGEGSAEKALEERSSIEREGGNGGRGPDNWFCERLRNANRDREEISAGTLPCSQLCTRSRGARLFSEKSARGSQVQREAERA